MEEKSPDLVKFDELYDKFCKQYVIMYTLQSEVQAMSLLLKESMGEDIFLKYLDDLAAERKQDIDDKEKGIENASFKEINEEKKEIE